MIPFPGQSVGVVDAYSSDARGWDLYEDVQFRGRGTDRAITAGVDWFCFAFHRSSQESLLEAADSTPLTVSWVVEVVSGSGTLALADRDDPTYEESTDPADYAALGTVTVSGAGTYTLGTSTFTADAIRTAGIFGGALALHVACTSGSVLVSQVKLRVWPTAGVAGGWSSGTYSQPPVSALPTYLLSGGDVASTYPDQGALRAALATAGTVEPYSAAGEILTAGSMSSIDPPDASPSAKGDPGIGYLRRGIAPSYTGPGTLGVDFIYPPGEVAGDANDVLFQPTGSDSVAWVQPASRVTISSEVVTGPGTVAYTGTLTVYAQEVDAPEPGGTPALPLVSGSMLYTITPTGSAEIQASLTLPEFPANKWLRVTVDHTGFHTAVDYNAGAALTAFRHDLDDQPLRYEWTPSPYRYWNPEAVDNTVYPHRLLQRGDGLGMGSARVYAQGTRQSTGRVFGSY